MSHHEKSGLQEWSIGETYPFCILVKGNSVQCYNAISGEHVGSPFPFDVDEHGKMVGESFELAHREAEAIAVLAKSEQVERDSLAARLRAEREQPVQEWSFLVPLVRDDNRQPHSPAAWEGLHNALIERFNGYTATKSGCELSGAWKSDAGQVIFDNSAEFRVAVTSPDALIEFCRQIAAEFGQQCIYVRQSSPNARLVYAL